MVSEYLAELANSKLFRNMSESGMIHLLDCIGATTVERKKDEYFLMQGDISTDISIVVAGDLVGERLTANGNVVTIAEFHVGDVFGDVLSGSSATSIVDVRACCDARVVRFSFEDLLNPCADAREMQSVLLRNLINEVSNKYFQLNDRVVILAMGSLRGKIARYLVDQQKLGADKTVICIPHNREEMARYLGCERSALSREISRMRDEGLFDVDHNRFMIHRPKQLQLLAE